MKKAIAGMVIAASASLSSMSAHASDPCEVVMCMFGLVQGQNSSQCDDAIASYFAIIEMHHGHPDLGATATARLAFTQQCKGAGSQFTSMIDNAFGSVIK
ncbi:TrbM/KikA/MpfK family conjugal transfer protein [Paraburkholderia gardini]|uniref:TrbM/KikA/MpfK family conjugal transfer protein n=1 Tax=Paraburkholderia gardini TaxID=2823469 RepID=UPI00389960FF